MSLSPSIFPRSSTHSRCSSYGSSTSSTTTSNGCGCSWYDECPSKKYTSYDDSCCAVGQHFGYTMKFATDDPWDTDGYATQHQCCRCSENDDAIRRSKNHDDNIPSYSYSGPRIYCICGYYKCTNRDSCWDNYYYDMECFENECSIIEIDDKTSRVEDYDKRTGSLRPHDSKKANEKHRRSRRDTRHFLRDHNRNSKKNSLSNSLRDFHL